MPVVRLEPQRFGDIRSFHAHYNFAAKLDKFPIFYEHRILSLLP
jgi:hypothetical protein